MNNYQTATCEGNESIIFNAILHEDSSTLGFLHSIIMHDPYKWAMIREVFSGCQDATLTVVDKSVDTPFKCLLLSYLCKQLEEELQVSFISVSLCLRPLLKETPGKIVTTDGFFDTTKNRNEFLLSLTDDMLDSPVKLSVRRSPMRERDIKIKGNGYTLHIRFEGGITNGWRIKNSYTAMLPASDLLILKDYDIECINRFMRGGDKLGVFINIELQPDTIDNF